MSWCSDESKWFPKMNNSMSEILSIQLTYWLQNIALTIPEHFYLYCVEFKFRSHSAGSCFIKKVILSFGSSITSRHNNGIQWFLQIKISGIERSPSLWRCQTQPCLQEFHYYTSSTGPIYNVPCQAFKMRVKWRQGGKCCQKKSVIEPLGQKESFM